MISRLLVPIVAISLSPSCDVAQPPDCNGQSVDSAQLMTDVSETRLELFKNLETGMARDAVVDLVGVPTLLCGSGISYDIYVLGDGGEIWIAYVDGNAAWAYESSVGDSGRRMLFGESDED